MGLLRFLFSGKRGKGKRSSSSTYKRNGISGRTARKNMKSGNTYDGYGRLAYRKGVKV